MTKHQITPHKGGRSERLYVRLRPDIKRKLEQAAKERQMSVADLIEQLTESIE